MKKQFVLGLTGGVLGLITALFVILTATTNDVTLSGVQAALFSTLGLMGAAIARKEPGLRDGCSFIGNMDYFVPYHRRNPQSAVPVSPDDHYSRCFGSPCFMEPQDEADGSEDISTRGL